MIGFPFSVSFFFFNQAFLMCTPADSGDIIILSSDDDDDHKDDRDMSCLIVEVVDVKEKGDSGFILFAPCVCG